MRFALYIAVMSLVTYLLRMIPLVLVKNKIKNRFVISFLYYVPYAVLSIMTIPGIFYSTDYLTSAVIGFLCAVILSYFEKSLITVAAAACAAVFVTELVIKFC